MRMQYVFVTGGIGVAVGLAVGLPLSGDFEDGGGPEETTKVRRVTQLSSFGSSDAGIMYRKDPMNETN